MAADTSRPKATTIFDVARLAGVSYQTVSRVLNNQPNVAPATKKSVEQAIRQLNYVPSQVARALVTRRSRMIGVLSFDVTHYGAGRFLEEFSAVVRREDYDVISVVVPSPEESALRAGVEVLLRQSVDVVVILAMNLGQTETMRDIDYGIPVVTVGDSSPVHSNVTSSDSYRGARRAVSHLYELGYRSIAHVGGPEDSPVAQARLLGWRDQLEDLGMTPIRALHGDWSAESGHLLASQLLEANQVDAVFAAGDDMAVGVLAAAQQLGRSAPEGLGVVGFDDVPVAAFQNPPLTTMRQDWVGIAEDAAAMVLALTKDHEAVLAMPMRVPQLIVRQSAQRQNP